MTVIWSGVTSEGAVVPVQVDGAGRVVATTGEPPQPPVIEYNGASAWGVFDGNTGVLSNGLNCSVVRNGTGDYAVTFTTPMPSANYSIQVAGVGGTTVVSYADPSATGFTLYAFDGGARTDPSGVSFAVFSSNALPPTGGTGTDAWGAFDGSAGADNSDAASFNIKAFTRLEAGTYQVDFVSPMPTNKYSVVTGWIGYTYKADKTTTGFQLITYGQSDGNPIFTKRDISDIDFAVNATNAVLPVTVTAEQLYAVTNNWYLEDESILTTRYKVEMQEGIKFAGGKAGITRDGELYFTSNGGKYVIAVNDEQIGLTRIDSAY